MINFFYLSTAKAKKIYSIYCFISINKKFAALWAKREVVNNV